MNDSDDLKTLTLFYENVKVLFLVPHYKYTIHLWCWNGMEDYILLCAPYVPTHIIFYVLCGF